MLVNHRIQKTLNNLVGLGMLLEYATEFCKDERGGE